MIHSIEENQIVEEVMKNSNKLSVINFFAEKCIPCEMLTPILQELDKKYSDLEVYKVNIGEYPNVKLNYSINSIPTLVFFKNGEEVERKIGLESLKGLSNIVESFE